MDFYRILVTNWLRRRCFIKLVSILLPLSLYLLVNLTAAKRFDLTPFGAQSNSKRNRVEIKVYRGANNEEEEYAPWGFVVRQPLTKPKPNADSWTSPSDKSDVVVLEKFPDPR